jgi:uncharacterized protein YqjF (DUF2071 family)
MDDVSHRPWPPPERPWVQAQSWVDLAFLHWRFEPAALQRLVPESVELQTFDGGAWLGITPFLVTGFRLRGIPPLPLISRFPEVNVRTYVSHEDKPGIWLFSLDAASTLAVEAAKRLYKLPYSRAQMRYERAGDFVQFEASRTGAAFSARYRGDGELFQPQRGSLEEFLTERYCLYTEKGGRLYRAELHHPPWQLQDGTAHVGLNTLAPLPLPDAEPHVLFSPRQDVVVWSLDELAL